MCTVTEVLIEPAMFLALMEYKSSATEFISNVVFVLVAQLLGTHIRMSAVGLVDILILVLLDVHRHRSAYGASNVPGTDGIQATILDDRIVDREHIDIRVI